MIEGWDHRVGQLERSFNLDASIEPDKALEPSRSGLTHTVRVWSPVAVAVYGLLLAFPAGFVLAIKNWRALGMHKVAQRHTLGALAASAVAAVVLIYLPARIVRGVAVAFNIAIFFYLKERLRVDIAAASSRVPSAVIQYRSWYSGLPWALCGLLLFLLFFAVLVVVLPLAGVEITPIE